jgi:hypothetical protein
VVAFTGMVVGTGHDIVFRSMTTWAISSGIGIAHGGTFIAAYGDFLEFLLGFDAEHLTTITLGLDRS